MFQEKNETSQTFLHSNKNKGFLNALIFLQVLVGSARNMYNCCVEGMNFEEFFEGKTVIFLSVK